MAADDPQTQEAQYQAWAARMQAKRVATKARMANDARVASGAPAEPSPTYWSSEALFADARLESEPDATRRPDPMVVAEMLAVLDLRDGADTDELTSAYRRLAKAHHPDRFAEADEATRAFHDERMVAVNRAYALLKALSSSTANATR